MDGKVESNTGQRTAATVEPQRAAPPPLAPGCALFLDFDGTLVDLAATPDQVRPAAELTALLVRMQELLGGALAIITGRRLESVDRLLAPLRLAGAGLHGLQLRLRAGSETPTDFPAEVGEVAAALERRYRGDSRILVENKGGAVALHYRLAPERAAESQDFLRGLAAAAGLDVILGHAVVEARPHGVNKGLALRQLHQVEPFRNRRPVFAGDDVTDEDAIVEAQALGGDGVRVGSARSAARWQLADVDAVHRWLRDSIEHLQAAP